MSSVPVLGQAYYNIKVDGRLLQNSEVLLEYAVVRSHRLYYLPTLEIRLIDAARVFATAPITDGSTVELQLSRVAGDNASWSSWRVFKCAAVESESGLGLSYVIAAYHNYPSYLLNRVDRAITATSADIGLEIAAAGAMNAVVDSVADRRTWRCSGKTMAEFFNREVVPHARKDDSSLFWTAVSAHSNTLYYRNVPSIELKARLRFTNNADARGYDHFFDDYEYLNQSGFANKLYGYGVETSVYDIGTGALKPAMTQKAVKMGSDMNMDKEMTATVRKVYAPIDVGNTGDAHAQSRTQNARIGSLYSVKCDILVRDYTTTDVFDVVQLDFASDSGGADDARSGLYLCVGKAAVATPREYCERLCFVRNAENLNSERTL